VTVLLRWLCVTGHSELDVSYRPIVLTFKSQQAVEQTSRPYYPLSQRPVPAQIHNGQDLECQSWSGQCRGKNKSLPVPVVEPRCPGRPFRSQVTTMTTIPAPVSWVVMINRMLSAALTSYLPMILTRTPNVLFPRDAFTVHRRIGSTYQFRGWGFSLGEGTGWECSS